MVSARETAAGIVRNFYEESPRKKTLQWVTEEVRQQILNAQRDALADYKHEINKYGKRNLFARAVCDRLMEIGDAVLGRYR